MIAVTVGPRGVTVADDPPPAVMLTQEPAGLRIELRLQTATNPEGCVVGRTIPVAQATELYHALGFLVGLWGQV